MYCKNCGKEITGDAKFCMYCGNPVEIMPANVQEPELEPISDTKPDIEALFSEPAPEENTPEPEPVRREKPSFDDINWDVSEYPDNNEVVHKTEDIDFNWNANPADIPEPVSKREHVEETQATAEPMSNDMEDSGDRFNSAMNGETLERAIFGEEPEPAAEMSAAARIDKFYTFNKKNEEFQQLLNREYDKVKSGNAIGAERTMADEIADERFEARTSAPKTMEDFLEEEGVVKPYQPKAFESDVLQRIEAQEEAKEAKKLEEEARRAAIEEARREAEEAKLAKLEEERLAAEAAKAQAEEEAREAARLAELAKAQAEEEARARAEEIARREAAEAKVRAEEQARRIAEEEARIKAQAVANYQAAEEARIKAEEELKAAQEAAKIKAQQEARKAAEAQARFEEEQEKRRLADQEAKMKLEAEQRKLEREANESIAAEEARKVLEQTARMKAAEAAKIKATVASLRAGASAASHKEIEEAHQATRNQINDMAKARNTFFGGFNIADEFAKDEVAVEPESVNTASEMSIDDIFDSKPAAPAEAEIEKVEVTGRETMLSGDMSATRVVDKNAVLSGITEDTINASKDTFMDMGNAEAFAVDDNAVAEEVAEPSVEPETQQEHAKYDDIDDLLSQLENVDDNIDEEFAKDEFDTILGQNSNDSAEETYELDDFVELEDVATPAASVDEPTMVVGSMPEDELKGADKNADDLSSTRRFDVDVPTGEVSGDTIVIGQQPQTFADLPSNDFDSYGEDIVAEQPKEETVETTETAAVASAAKTGEEPVKTLSKKEQKAAAKKAAAEAKAQAKAAKKAKKAGDDSQSQDNEEDGGKGSVVLKIVLIILCVILAAEVAGIGVHFVAPQSKIAEFVDTQLNTVLHKITGDDTDYSVFGEERRTAPLEDKTSLIEANTDKNYKGAIKSIKYNADLKYKEKDCDKVSDLVLSGPITEVEWGRDSSNNSIYYDNEVIGAVIAYESGRYEWMKNGDDHVMSVVDKSSGLYSTLKNKKGVGSGTFERLEIGEIRNGGTAYYVWIKEVMSDGSVTKVLKMNPGSGYNMLMNMAYTL